MLFRTSAPAVITKRGLVWRGLPSMVRYGEDYQARLGMERINKRGWVWRGLPSMVGYGEDYEYQAWLGMEKITTHGWV